jgi:hypothetical protein
MEGREAALDSEADGKEEHEQNDSPALVACGKSRKTHTFRRKKKKRESVVVLNVVDTKYEIVRHVGKNILGWKLCRESQVSKNWDVYWTDSAIRTEFLAKLEKYQKVNHFPGMPILSPRDGLHPQEE